MKNNASIQQQLALSRSPLTKYRLATVGDRSFLQLALTEIIFCTVGSISGRVGALLRSVMYSLLFRKIGRSVVIGRDCSFRRTHRIELCDNVSLGDKVMLDVKGDQAGIFLGTDVHVGASSIFSCPGGQITIGDGTRIGAFSRLGSLQGLKVGRNCVIGARTYIVGAGHETGSTDCPIIEQSITCKGPSAIGDNVVIGDGVTVLDGVTIGSGAVVENGSLVIRDVAPGARISGVPVAKALLMP